MASLTAGIILLLASSLPAAATGFKIGLSLPLAGDVSLLARQFLDGARLAVEILAPEGEIELMVADDGCAPDIAELAAADLRSADISIATGFLCNDAARAAAQAFIDTDIPVLVAGARSDQLMEDAADEGWGIWRMAPSDEDAVAFAAGALSRRWQDKPWAIVDDGTVPGRTFADELRARMEEAGQPPQFADNFRPAQSTQAGLVRRLQRAGVSAAFVAANAEDVAVIAKDMREFGADIELVGGPPLALLPWIDQKAGLPDGLLAIVEPDPATLESAKGLTLLLQQRGIEPEPYVYLGYAALEIAMAALRDDPREIANTLDKTVFRTALGNFDFDATGRNRANPYRLYVWRNGAFRPAGEAMR